MGIKLTNEDHRTRLFKAMQLSWQKLEGFRNLNTSLIEEYAGSNYGVEGSRPKYETMLNLMGQAVKAYVMELAAGIPRVVVETNRDELTFFAQHYAIAINKLLQEISLGEKIRKWVTSAFFSMGVMKVHMADTAEIELWDGVWINPGTPMVSNVGLDDWVHDMSATRWDQIKFAADSYRIPFEDLKGSQFDQKVVRDLVPTTKQNFAGWFQRTEMISKGYQTDQDDVEPMIDLMDVWLPRERKIATFAMHPSSRFTGNLDPVCVLDWEGSEYGPYHALSFADVPENLMPTSPAAQLASLARLTNNILRKQARQAKRQKDVHTYTAAGTEAAKKIQRTNDGEWVNVNDTSDIATLKMGGVDAGNQAFLMHCIELFDRAAGNLPGMLGLGPQADTLGQEQLMLGSQSKTLAEMRLRVNEEVTRLVRNLAFMLWNDAAKSIPGRMQIPGVDGATIESNWTPEWRMGQFYDYDLSIDVFSMQYQPPQAKVAKINELLQAVYIPLAGQLQQQGGSINLQALTDVYAELLMLPRLKQIVQFSTPSSGEAVGGGGEAGSGPAQTTRTYVRKDAPRTAKGQQLKAADWMARAEQTNPQAAMQRASQD